MAVDEALLHEVTEPVLRFYQWSEPAVTIGYFQSWREVPEGRPFARRYTGGGLVDHARDFTYSIVLPKGHPLDVRGTSCSYEAVHRAVADALCREGFEVRVVSAADPQPHAACFQRAVKYDVSDGLGKVAGAAQRRSRSGTLHQGSVLPPAAFSFDSFCNSFFAELSPLLGDTAQEDIMTEAEVTRARELEVHRYATETWNRQK